MGIFAYKLELKISQIGVPLYVLYRFTFVFFG